VRLTKEYTRPVPFMVDWNYELLGDKLRAEFDEWFAQKERETNAGMGKTKQLLRGEFVKRFMVSKQVNLVDDPASGNLRSVFILRKDEEKLIDGRAKESLAPRYEYKQEKDKEGELVYKSGFMKFKLVEGEEKRELSEEETFQVTGNDIQYFQEEQSKPEVKEEKEEESFICETCGKEFDSKRALHGHSLSHLKDK
jgi:hypothetical protein